MYVRNLRKPSATKNVYKFASSKNRSVIFVWKFLRTRLLLSSRILKDVVSFQSQPEGFYYSSGNKLCPYTPDFLVRNQDGSEYFLEVKPLNKTFPEDFKNAFASKRIAAQKLGKPLILVTDKQIRNGAYLENLKLINRYSGLVDFSLSATKSSMSWVI